MGFLTSLFGSDNAYITAAIGLAIVLVLIVLGVWLIKVLSQATRSVGRGRARRLGVVDAVPLDQRRQAILLRRDNVEHLIITGGGQDIVVESGIEAQASTAPRANRRTAPPVAAPARPATTARAPRREPQMGGYDPAGDNRGHLHAVSHQPPQAEPKRRTSLRHTGLLRPVESGETPFGGGNPQNTRAGSTDSGNDNPGTGERAQGSSPHGSPETGESDNQGPNFRSRDH